MNAQHIAHIIYKGTIAHGAIFSVWSLWKRRWPLAQKLGAVELFAWVTVAWVFHAWAFGHPPVQGPYETALSLAFIGGLVMLGLSFLHKAPYMAFYPAVIFILLLHGNRFEPGGGISIAGPLAYLHLGITYVVFGIAAALGAAALLNLCGNQVPLRRIFLPAYLTYGAMILLAGAFRWAAFGASVPLDPMEMIHMAAFTLFSVLTAAAAFLRWEGRPAAICGLIGSLAVMLSYRLVLLFAPTSSYHR